jgi:hypothetical protein
LTPQTQAQKEAEARKRSEAAKKAAATRKKNEEEEAAKKAEGESSEPTPEKPENESSETKPEKPENESSDQDQEQESEPGPIPGKFSQESPAEVRLPSPEELAAQEHEERVTHNERTGGGDVHKDELQAQRDEHNRRTAGIGV